MKLPGVPDLNRDGKQNDSPLAIGLIVGAIGFFVYVGTGPDAWTDRRWSKGLSGGTVYLGLLFPGWGAKRLGDLLYRRGLDAGQLIGEERGFKLGYNVPNPALAAAREGMAQVGAHPDLPWPVQAAAGMALAATAPPGAAVPAVPPMPGAHQHHPVADPIPERHHYDDLTVADLRTLAAAHGIAEAGGRRVSSARRDDLLDALIANRVQPWASDVRMG